MRRLANAAIWLSIILVPAAASAQGSIVGVVRDTSGAVLPGATVEAASPVLIEKVRIGVTDSAGQYRIDNLAPGTYSVTYSLPGFSTVRRDGIELSGSFTASVNAEMRVGAVEETVTVTGEAPIVDVQGTTREQSLGHEIIDLVPSGRGTNAVNNLGLLAPGVVQGAAGLQDVGGTTSTPTPVTFRAHGSDNTDQHYTQNGISMVSPLSAGYFSRLVVNTAATKEMTFSTGAVNAELPMGGVRVNIIPRDGGNVLEGTLFVSFANGGMQSTNLTPELEARGLTGTNKLKKIWDINPGVGGPLKRDTLWFYLSGMYTGNINYAAGMYHSLNANNPNAWTYAPDLSRPATNDERVKDGQARLTWQATPKNRLGLTWHDQVICGCPIDISASVSPDGSRWNRYPVQRQVQIDWLAPLTNRVLVEAGALHYTGASTLDPVVGTNPAMIGVTEQSNGLRYRTADFDYRNNPFAVTYSRGGITYLTAGHALKVGFNHTRGWTENSVFSVNPLTYRFNNGIPNQITQVAYPYSWTVNIDHGLGLYAQDKWTVRRFTMSYGLRYDLFKSGFPEQHLGPTPFTPTRNISFPAQDGISLQDLTPKFGAAYDPFGTGKAALKVTLNKYLQGLGTSGIAAAVSPTNLFVTQTTRAWTDANRDYVPNCDLTLPGANGECGAMAASDFGATRPGSAFDPETLTGWGKRFYNWEFSTGVQHELMPRLSLDVAFFRRWFGNFLVTDNLLAGPSDYTAFDIVTPVDPRLPGGGGYTVSGVLDLNPNKVGQVSNLVTFADNYGTLTRRWNGVDISLNARPRAGIFLQGSFSTGRENSDWCDVAATLPEAAFGTTSAALIGALPTVGFSGGAAQRTPTQFCNQGTGFRSQVKVLGSYTIPRIDVIASLTFQGVDGPAINANYVATNAVVAPSLGRSLSGNAANATVAIVSPGEMYGERSNRIDLRVGKAVRLGGTRSTVNLDVFNLMNANPVLLVNANYASWQTPQRILAPRLLKIGVQFDF